MVRRSVLAVVAVALLVAGCSGDGDDAAPRDPVPGLPRVHAEPDPVGGGRLVDADGREVLLRGVNVNALAEYWAGTDFPTTFPLADDDPERMASIGWNAVRLVVSWSEVEPAPGRYDEEYLDEVATVVDELAAVGIYTIVDLHQDAWGATLAADPDALCPAGSEP
ncbi:MAG: cellulase family glycosylhydrolase, partial [Acidimicrobiia bacterium]